MAGKLSASRLVSARTTAPRAPMASSSHMNQNRCWPGVPKRYSTRSRRRLIRPKSIATVVVVFASAPAVRSMRKLAAEIVSSVRSGLISLTAPTSVVLPTPNPPASKILMARYGGGLAGSTSAGSQAPQSIKDLPERVLVDPLTRRDPVDDRDQA